MSASRSRSRSGQLVPLAMLAAAFVGLAACGADEKRESESTPTGDAAFVDAELRVHYEHPIAGLDLRYTISCAAFSAQVEGDDGVDVDPARACETLDDPDVATRLTDGPPESEVCTEIYGGPDTAEIQGTISGEAVDTTADRVDGCAIDDWDDLLNALLPSAVGVESPD